MMESAKLSGGPHPHLPSLAGRGAVALPTKQPNSYGVSQFWAALRAAIAA